MYAGDSSGLLDLSNSDVLIAGVAGKPFSVLPYSVGARDE